MERFFLTSKKEPTVKSRRAAYWIYNILFLLAGCTVVSLFCLRLAVGVERTDLFAGYFEVLPIFLLNTLPIVLLVFALWFIIGRSWIAFLIGSVFFTVLSTVNFFKLVLRNDPVIFSDIFIIGTAAKVSGQYDIVFNRKIILAFLFVVIFTVLLFFFARGRIRKKIGIPAFVLVIILCIFPISRLYNSDTVYNRNANPYTETELSATERYISRGFIYPLFHSVREAFPKKPAGYTDEKAEEILASYTSEDIPENKKADIFLLQLEAFNDLRRLGVTGIDGSVYSSYDKIKEGAVANGLLVTNIFAGGTVDTERCVATGFTDLINFRADAGSYVRYMEEQGYTVEGAHPCYKWFYNRENINKYLGFPEYYYYENRYEAMGDIGVFLDKVFLPDLMTIYDARDKSKPYFNLSVTYQGHGPYEKEKLYWGDEVYWERKPDTDDETFYILNNYLASLKDTSERLLELLSEFDKRENPVIFCFFGDHNPWLGDGNSVYNYLGTDLDNSTLQGFYNYYSTEYVIWANKAALKSLNLKTGITGPSISPGFLMGYLFKTCGLGKGSGYMQLMQEVLDRGVTVVSTSGAYIENGVLTESVDCEDIIEKMKTAQYYRRTHTGYN